jgi:hypothetical protein
MAKRSAAMGFVPGRVRTISVAYDMVAFATTSLNVAPGKKDDKMAFTDILKNTAKKLAISSLALAPLALASQAKAQDITVNPTMDYTTINSTIASRTAGDTVFFECGTYNRPADPNAFYRLNIDGVNIDKDASCGASEEVILKTNPSVLGHIIFRVTSIGNTISNLTFEGNNDGRGIILDSSFDPAKPVNITGNEFRNLEQAITWANSTVVGDNSLPSVKITGNVFNNLAKGNIYDQGINPNNTQTSWALVSGNTGNGIDVGFFDPPKLPIPSTTYSTSGPSGPVGLGVAEFDNNVLINSDGVTMPANILPMSSLNGSVASADSNVPEKNGEYQIALNPDPGFPFSDYLENLYVGAGNFTSNPQFTTHLRPLPGNAAPMDGTWSGARPPAGDFNADGLVNDIDQIAMGEAILKKDIGLTTNEVRSGDVNYNSTTGVYGDGKVNYSDIDTFCNIYEAANPASTCTLRGLIPAASGWGLALLTLATLTAATITLARRRAA